MEVFVRFVKLVLVLFPLFAYSQKNKQLTVEKEAVVQTHLDSFDLEVKKLSTKGLHFETAEVLLNKAKYCEDIGEYQWANEAYKQAIVENSLTDSIPQKGRILNNLGVLYFQLDQFEMALDMFVTAKNVGAQYADSGSIYKATLNMANCYHKLGAVDRSVEMMREAYRFIPIEDMGSNDEALYWMNLGTSYFREGHDSTFYCYQRSLKIAERLANPKTLATLYSNLAGHYALEDKKDSALLYAEKSIQYGDQINYSLQVNSEWSYHYVHYLLTDDPIHIQKLDSIRSVVSAKRMKEYTYKIDGILAEYYEETGDFEKAYFINEEMLELNQELNKKSNAIKIKGYEMRLLSEAEAWKGRLNEKQVLLEKEQSLNRWLMLVGGITVLALLGFLLFWRQRIRSYRLEEQKVQLMGQKEQLSTEIVEQNQVILEKTAKLTEKNATIEHTAKALEKVRDNASQKTAKEIQSLLIDLKRSIKGNHWEEFEHRFTKIHPNFYNNLIRKYSNLTPNDKRMAAFIRLGLSNKEMAELTRQSVNSIEVAKSRLKKKILPQESQVSIEELMLGL